jgi:hypothetical protein
VGSSGVGAAQKKFAEGGKMHEILYLLCLSTTIGFTVLEYI